MQIKFKDANEYNLPIYTWIVLKVPEGFFIEDIDGDLEGGYWSSIKVIKDYIKEDGCTIIEE